jgi:hypothetical protein
MAAKGPRRIQGGGGDRPSKLAAWSLCLCVFVVNLPWLLFFSVQSNNPLTTKAQRHRGQTRETAFRLFTASNESVIVCGQREVTKAGVARSREEGNEGNEKSELTFFLLRFLLSDYSGEETNRFVVAINEQSKAIEPQRHEDTE